ncbi:MAG: RNA 2',3'-cyclic phosphodiesterase [Candidatus Aminicenantes bacterium]|nr:RNA 2',3'-cyclic phosphodiesterase [Candidatus Aminicenantes bacterium]
MRTFIAIDLDTEIKEALSALIDKLRERHQNIRWVRREAMHLTLKFLGEIDKERVPEIKNILEKVVRNYQPFFLKITGTGYFPAKKKNPRVLWTGVEADEALTSLQQTLERELQKIGFAEEKRDFHPHLTLGRVKFPSSIQETMRELESHQESVFGEMTVKKITLFQSILKPSGAEYKALSEHQLK